MIKSPHPPRERHPFRVHSETPSVFGDLNMRLAKTIAIVFIAAALLAACATQPQTSAFEPPGFWFGALHGAISPFALIGAFFKEGVRIYAFPNSGWWYDFGYVIGFGVIFGGGVRSAQ